MFWSLWVWSFKTAQRIASSSRRNTEDGSWFISPKLPHPRFSLWSRPPRFLGHWPRVSLVSPYNLCGALVQEFKWGICRRLRWLLFMGLPKSRVFNLRFVRWTRRPVITKKLYVKFGAYVHFYGEESVIFSGVCDPWKITGFPASELSGATSISLLVFKLLRFYLLCKTVGFT